MSSYTMLCAARTSLLTSSCASRLWWPVNEAAVTLVGSQNVRWRKARWLPTAKSKMFRIPVKRLCSEEETIELKRLFNIHRSRMNAIKRHLYNEIKRTAATSELALQQAADEDAEHQVLMEYNHQENLRVAALREERVHKDLEEDMARVEAGKKFHAKKAILAEEEALRIIAEMQELAKTFIKREDLEEAIEAAIANPVDYNFALDYDGHIFHGRSTKPEDLDEKDWEKLPTAASQ